ncbi:TfpX/TfpZ family type IV pilin accessory protein [Acinetobacter sp. YH12200]|uniref:TfpX/TfpZ family type IV pilin accessory protein n=1 Tax=unclassified Acinetobacter TaxID=196816 RepID=UPI0015D2D248|nr:TfpX/TfpZ family type IV pilin accessory protein [Acinetobacter sp. YH12200]
MKSKCVRFFLWHFFISICIAIIALLWVFNIWYPSPLAKATGILKIFFMLLVIDVILGPLLGCVVYKEKKKSLKFDLVIIFLLQFSALIYGLYSISQARPVWIAYNVDRFELIRVNDLITDGFENTYAEYRYPTWLKPKFVGVEISKNIEEKNQNLFEEVLGGISIAQRPERYVDLIVVKPQIQERAQDLMQLKQFNEAAQVESILAKYPTANAWLPLKANAEDMVVLVNKDTAEVVKIVDLRPWN